MSSNPLHRFRNAFVSLSHSRMRNGRVPRLHMRTVPQHRHLLLFDGVCALCSGFVQFVLRHDKDALFDFASLQSTVGRVWTTAAQRQPSPLTSMMVVRDYRSSPDPLVKGRAAIFVIGALGLPWTTFRLFSYVPGVVLNVVYDAVASRRYQIAGIRTACFVAGAEVRERFIDLPPACSATDSANEQMGADPTATDDRQRSFD